MNTSSSSSKLGTWFDSILDLFVCIGFPTQVPEELFSHNNNNDNNSNGSILPSLSVFFTKSIMNGRQPANWFERYMNVANGNFTHNNQKHNNNNHNQKQKQPSNIFENPATEVWCENIRKTLAQVLLPVVVAAASWQNQKHDQDDDINTKNNSKSKNHNHNNNYFSSSSSLFRETPLDVCGASSNERSFYLVPTCGVSSSSFDVAKFQLADMSLIQLPQQYNTNNNAENNHHRNVSAVISLIVDGNNQNQNNGTGNRLAREVFKGNVNAVVDILSSIGLVVNNNNNNNNLPISTSVNGLLWTTLGSLQLQRSVLLQAAIFHLLKKLCGLNFVVIESENIIASSKTNNQNSNNNSSQSSSTSMWKCDPLSFASSHGNSLNNNNNLTGKEQVALITSVLSALITLSNLEENEWYLFPTASNNNNNKSRSNLVVPSLLQVLSVLGFVTLTRGQQQQQQQNNNNNNNETGNLVYLFKVLPEFRDAMFCTGAVELKKNQPSILSSSNQGHFSTHSISGGMLRSVSQNNNNNTNNKTGGAMMMLNQSGNFNNNNGSNNNFPEQDCVIVETNFRVYVHLVPVRNPYFNNNNNAQQGQENNNNINNPEMMISHRGQTLLSILGTFLEREALVPPIFAVFRLTRESFLGALRRGLTTDSIIRFLEAKSHPMAVAHYSSISSASSSSMQHSSSNNKDDDYYAYGDNNSSRKNSIVVVSGVPRALKDQMVAWGKEAERICLKREQVLLTFPTSATCHKLLAILASRLNGGAGENNNNNDNQNNNNNNNNSISYYEKMTIDEMLQNGSLPAHSVFVANGFQVALSEKLWPLISDLLPAS